MSDLAVRCRWYLAALRRWIVFFGDGKLGVTSHMYFLALEARAFWSKMMRNAIDIMLIRYGIPSLIRRLIVLYSQVI